MLNLSLGLLDGGVELTLKPLGPGLLQVQGYGRNLGTVIRLKQLDGTPVLRYSEVEFSRGPAAVQEE